MTLSVAVARSTGEDISQTLQNRAAEEENPVRSGILQLMADKRFLDTVSPVLLLCSAQVLCGLVEFGEEGFYAGYYGLLGGERGERDGKVFYDIA